MGLLKNSIITSTLYFLVNFELRNGFLNRKATYVITSLWIFVFTGLVILFNFIQRIFLRNLKGKDYTVKPSSRSIIVMSPGNENRDRKQDNVEITERDSPMLVFEFPTLSEYLRIRKWNDCWVESFVRNDLDTLVKKPKILGEEVTIYNKFQSEDDFKQEHLIAEDICEDVDSEGKQDVIEELEFFPSSKCILFESVKPVCARNGVSSDQEALNGRARVLTDNDVSCLEFESESIYSPHEFSLLDHIIDSCSEGFLSEKDFECTFELNNVSDTTGMMDKKENDSMDKLQEENNFDDNEQTELADKTCDPCAHNSSARNPEDPHGIETLGELQDFIQELKWSRAYALPTIIEENEEEESDFEGNGRSEAFEN